MNSRFTLLALAAVNATMFALPALASAEITYLHLSPTPSGVKTIDDSNSVNPKLSTTGGTTIECDGFHGEATFELGGTTGTILLTFGPTCHVVPFPGLSCTSAGEATGNIATTVLPFHLVTLPNNKPGFLVTPTAGGTGTHFATFTCFGVNTVVTGNGVLGTIENDCGSTSETAKLDFKATAHGQQEHKTVADETIEWDLNKGEETAAQEAAGEVTFKENIELRCT